MRWGSDVLVSVLSIIIWGSGLVERLVCIDFD